MEQLGVLFLGLYIMIINSYLIFLFAIALVFFFILNMYIIREKKYFILRILNVFIAILPIYWFYYGIITNNPPSLGTSNHLIRGDEYMLVYASYIVVWLAIGNLKLKDYIDKHPKR